MEHVFQWLLKALRSCAFRLICANIRRFPASERVMLAPSDKIIPALTEIDVEGVGKVRPLNEWAWMRIRKLKGQEGWNARLAESAGMTRRQFRGLSADRQQAVNIAYQRLIDVENVPRVNIVPPQPLGARFKGRHLSLEEKVQLGRALLATQAQLARGYFGRWLEKAQIPKHRAADCMALARHTDRQHAVAKVA